MKKLKAFEYIGNTNILISYNYSLVVSIHGDEQILLHSVKIGVKRNSNISLASERDYVTWCDKLSSLIGGNKWAYNADVIKNR